MISVIARHELRSLFFSPLAWVVLALAQLLLAYIFLLNIDAFIAGQEELALKPEAPGATLLVVVKTLLNAPTILMIVIPLITMRFLSDERRMQTRMLLMSSPVSMTSIVLGKYLALVLFFLLLWLMLALMSVSLSMGTMLDLGHIVAALLALWLFIMVVAAIGLFMSAVTAQPAIAAFSSFVIVLLLWIIDSGSEVESGVSILSHLSMSRHYQALLSGLIGLHSVAYFLLLTLMFLLLTMRRLYVERVYG